MSSLLKSPCAFKTKANDELEENKETGSVNGVSYLWASPQNQPTFISFLLCFNPNAVGGHG